MTLGSEILIFVIKVFNSKNLTAGKKNLTMNHRIK